MLANINWWLVLGVSLLQIFIGSVWYGPMFGKFWMKLMGADKMTKEEIKKAQKEMMPMYLIQFLMSLVMNIALYSWIKIDSVALLTTPYHCGAIGVAFALWLGFVLPIQAGEVIWSGLSNSDKIKKLGVSAGQQLLTMIIAAVIFSNF